MSIVRRATDDALSYFYSLLAHIVVKRSNCRLDGFQTSLTPPPPMRSYKFEGQACEVNGPNRSVSVSRVF